MQFQFTKPSTHKLERATEEVFQDLLVRMKSDLDTTSNVAVTTDIWSTKQLIDSFLGVTAHFYNKELGRSESFRIGKSQVKILLNIIFVSSLQGV